MIHPVHQSTKTQHNHIELTLLFVNFVHIVLANDL